MYLFNRFGYTKPLQEETVLISLENRPEELTIAPMKRFVGFFSSNSWWPALQIPYYSFIEVSHLKCKFLPILLPRLNAFPLKYPWSSGGAVMGSLWSANLQNQCPASAQVNSTESYLEVPACKRHLDFMVVEGKGEIKDSRYTLLNAKIHLYFFV